MRKVTVLFITALFAILLAQAPAFAYTGTPGGGPNAGPTDTGKPSAEPQTQVRGEHFTGTPKGVSSGGGFLASTGADIAELVAIALAAIAIGTVFVRRGRPQLA